MYSGKIAVPPGGGEIINNYFLCKDRMGIGILQTNSRNKISQVMVTERVAANASSRLLESRQKMCKYQQTKNFPEKRGKSHVGD
jgi:hypothetical protein